MCKARLCKKLKKVIARDTLIVFAAPLWGQKQRSWGIMRKPPYTLFYSKINRKYAKNTDASPGVTDEDVAIGMVAFCTPSPRAEKRRLVAGEGAAEPMPLWSQSRCGKSRIRATESEKG